MKRLLLLIIIVISFYSATAQPPSISGQLKSDHGEPVPFAVVANKNNKIQVVTDANGRFTIKAAIEDVLIVSSVGYNENSINVAGNEMNIIMQTSIIDLGNVIVGSRSLRRTATETAAPVDLIPVSKVMNQIGQVDVNQILQF